MKGNWEGFYKYSRKDVQKAIGFEKTFFTLTINFFDGTHFAGIVNDDISTGGMKETGKVEGYVIGNKFFFKKFMPHRNLILDRTGTRKTMETSKHPTLFYSGTLSQDKKEVNGQWKFEYSIAFLWGIIPIPFRPGKGTWAMKLTSMD